MPAEFSINADEGNDTPSAKELQEARKARGKSRRRLVLAARGALFGFHSWIERPRFVVYSVIRGPAAGGNPESGP
jgi:hypothetical protein